MSGTKRVVGRKTQRERKEWDRMVKPLEIDARKVNIFVWRLMLGRLPSRMMLEHFCLGIDLDSLLYPRCNMEVESIKHALISCMEVKKTVASSGMLGKGKRGRLQNGY